MQRQQVHMRKLDSRRHGFRHGIWDVVEFQVEKNPCASVRELLNCPRTLGSKELAADFKEPDCPAKFPR